MRNTVKTFPLILLTILLLSCVKQSDFDLKKCKQLSYQYFKGLPKESHQYNKYCKSFKLDFLQEDCKKALNELILGKTQGYLIKKYDNDIMLCFTKNDLEKFLN